MIGNLKIILSVYSDGSVSWMPPALFRATCNIKVKLFPFDKQQCRLIFRSTDYDATLMDFRTRLLRVKLLVISLETHFRSALKEKHVLLNNLISKFQMFHQNGLFWILRNNFWTSRKKWRWWHFDAGDLKLMTIFECWCPSLMLMTKMAKAVTDISHLWEMIWQQQILSSTFVTNTDITTVD